MEVVVGEVHTLPNLKHGVILKADRYYGADETYGDECSSFHGYEREDLDELFRGDKLKFGRRDGRPERWW